MADLIETVLEIALLPSSAIPEHSLSIANLSLFDWMISGRGGIDEPVSIKLRQFAEAEGGLQIASIFGAGKAPARAAALVNGTTSHVLDYDDTHFAHIGHLSVGIYPAALAVAEETGASASDVVEAFLLGAETAIRVGMVLGTEHYNKGFHQTATAGAFGATVACGRLLGLTRQQMRNALGLAATRSSGLKSQFGTMGKSYNAGISASNGVECAKLAALDMTSCDDGLMGIQGFIDTHCLQPENGIAPANEFLFDTISYKFHACCHGTHAMIEGLLEIMPKITATDALITAVKLRTNPRWMRVCNIANPTTGLEVKFSYRWLAGMIIEGENTSSISTYTDKIAEQNSLIAFADKVFVEADESVSDMQAKGHVKFADGTSIQFSHDLSEPQTIENLRQKLTTKANAVLGNEASHLLPILEKISELSAADLGNMVRGE